MAYLSHNGGIVQGVLELGFDRVKFFEGDITSTASGFTISPPARRITVNNRSTTLDVYLRLDGGTAVASTAFLPGDNIKICPQGSFSMDFDTISAVSFITASGTAHVEGLLGFKGTIDG